MPQRRAPRVHDVPFDLAPGQHVYDFGDAANGLFRIRAGRVRLVAPHEGRERLVALLGPGDMFGDVAGADHTRPETARCDLRTTLCVLAPGAGGSDVDESATAELVEALLADRRERSRRLRLLCLENVENRLAAVLADLASRVGEPCRHGSAGRDLTSVTQEDLADLVGSSRAFVSTTLNRLKRDGVLAAIGRVLCLHGLMVGSLPAEPAGVRPTST